MGLSELWCIYSDSLVRNGSDESESARFFDVKPKKAHFFLKTKKTRYSF